MLYTVSGVQEKPDCMFGVIIRTELDSLYSWTWILKSIDFVVQ